MTLQEEFSKIVAKEQKNEIEPFLRKLEKSDKVSLRKHVKSIAKEYFDWGGQANGRWGRKASNTQTEIINLARFICFDKTEFVRAFRDGLPFKNEELLRLLEWHHPPFFADYLNGLTNDLWRARQLDYYFVLELKEKGYADPSPELIIALLPEAIYKRIDKENSRGWNWVYSSDILKKYPITLEEHIWYIFQYESTIKWADERTSHWEDEKKKTINRWYDTIELFTKEGTLERKRVLKEAILATNRNFDKTLTGWFCGLILRLEPTKEEALELQAELYNALNSPHSKAVNTSLKYLKLIATEKGFDPELLLQNSSILLSSEVKSIVNSTLMLMDKTARKHKKKASEVCITASQAFFHNDDGIQERAAKLIAKHGDPKNEELKASLTDFYPTMFVDAKAALSNFIIEEEIAQPDVVQEIEEAFELEADRELQEIPAIESIDDLVFLASQAFDSNQAYHIDQLPAALIRFQNEIKGKNIAKLQPAFQRAYDLLMGEWRGSVGFLDHMLANFFVDYGKLLMEFYPEEAYPIRKLHNKYKAEDDDRVARWKGFKPNLAPLGRWNLQSQQSLYNTHKRVLIVSLEILKAKKELPLLSMPTHSPCWVAPEILVYRLFQYQKAQFLPNTTDLQVAISRTNLRDTKNALEKAQQTLTGEYLALMTFLLDKDASPQGEFKTPAEWMVAAITKNKSMVYPEFEGFPFKNIHRSKLTGNFSWRALVENYRDYEWSRKNGRYTRQEVIKKRKALRINFYEQAEPKSKGFWDRIKDRLFPKKFDFRFFLYSNIVVKSYFEPNDIYRFLCLFPNNPDPWIARVIENILWSTSVTSETDKRCLIRILEGLLELDRPYGKMGHLLIAATLMCSDQNSRAVAAENWISGVSRNLLDSQKIGDMMGEMETIELAPLKRFTDLLFTNMFQVSTKHNLELEKLLNGLISKLPENPMTNTKKLLDVYKEVIHLNNSSITNPEVLKRLKAWENSPSIKKVAQSLVEMK